MPWNWKVATLLQYQDMDDDNEYETDGSTRTLQAAVKSALTSAYDINATDIAVSRMGSYVILEGRVRNRGDIYRAIEIAEEIAGEGKVKSRLINRWWLRRTLFRFNCASRPSRYWKLAVEQRSCGVGFFEVYALSVDVEDGFARQ